MTTFKHPNGKTWRYDFWWKPPGAAQSQRYQGSTGQLTKADADAVEADIKRRIRQEAYGIAPIDRMRTPSFTVWAGEHFAYVTKKGKLQRPDALESDLRLCLQFWGARPTRQPALSTVPSQWRYKVAAARARAAAAPYHDLRLLDPIIEPDWIERFEDWLTCLGLSGARKNHYRSAMSGMYRTALLPAFRKKTGVAMNPFLNIERDSVPARDATLSVVQLRALIAAAAPHLRLAMAIAAYAPELREKSILSLAWRDHLNPAMTRITVEQHKTRRHTGRAQIVPVSVELQAILMAVRKAQPRTTYVVSYNGRGVKRINRALATAAKRANKITAKGHAIIVGTKHGGITFHSIRHTLATLLAEWGESEAIRMLVMGWRTAAMAQRYTHMAATGKVGPLERVAAHLQLTEAVQGPVQAARRSPRRKTPESSHRRDGNPPRRVALKR